MHVACGPFIFSTQALPCTATCSCHPAVNRNFFPESSSRVCLSFFQQQFSVPTLLKSLRYVVHRVLIFNLLFYLIYGLLEHTSTRPQCRQFCCTNNKAQRQCQHFCRSRQLSFSLKRQNLGGAVDEWCQGRLKVVVDYILYAVVVYHNKYQLISGHCLSLNLYIPCAHIYPIPSVSQSTFELILRVLKWTELGMHKQVKNIRRLLVN